MGTGWIFLETPGVLVQHLDEYALQVEASVVGHSLKHKT